MANKSLVLDANILIGAVLDQRVRGVVEIYEAASFFIPQAARSQAEEHLDALVAKGSRDPATALELLRTLVLLLNIVEPESYRACEPHTREPHAREPHARDRLGTRAPDDWPIRAAALALNCPIWTEDNDFFGCGGATRTANRVEIYLRG